MKYRIFIPIILLAIELPFAQLVPQKSNNSSVKIDHALIFKVDYTDETLVPDSTSQKADRTEDKKVKKNNSAMSLAAKTGVCLAGATLLTLFGNNLPLTCIPLPTP
jgi:hypothetical protein